MGSGLPRCVDYWRAVNRSDPPLRELTEWERLLLAAHREANNIWASAQLSSPHHAPVDGAEWRVCASALLEKKKKIAVTSHQQIFFFFLERMTAIWREDVDLDVLEKHVLKVAMCNDLCKVYLPEKRRLKTYNLQ